MSKSKADLTKVLRFILGFVGSQDGINPEVTKVLAAVGAVAEVLEEEGTNDRVLISCVHELANVVGLDGAKVCLALLTWVQEDEDIEE